MSHENVEVLRAFFEAWNAGDMDAVRALHDPHVIQRPPEGWPEPGPFVGREAVMRQYEQLRDAWERDTLEPTSDFIDAGDRVVVSTPGVAKAGPSASGRCSGRLRGVESWGRGALRELHDSAVIARYPED
jgi:ketosteroid isomerase-like protein